MATSGIERRIERLERQVELAAAKKCQESGLKLIMVGLYESDAEALAGYGLSEFPKGVDVFRWPESTRWAFAALKAGAPMAEVRAGKWSKGPYQPTESDSSSRP